MRAAAILVSLLSTVAVADGPAYKVDNHVLAVPHAITYADAKLAGSDAAIDYVAGFLADKAYVTLLRIEVHADTDGDARQNQRLTERRALAVARALVAKGADCKRLLPVGFGGTKPVMPNDTAANKAANRRTTFALAALRGRAIGGMPVDGGGVVAGDPCH